MHDVGVATAKNRRPYMEDFVRVEDPFRRDDTLYVGVFDGHGGDAVARRAASEMHGLLAAELLRGSPPDALAAAFRAFDESVAAEACGSTATVVILQEATMTVANAGDSHVLLASPRGGTVVTADHRLTNEHERERVIAAGAVIQGPYACLPNGEGLMCTRSLGDRELRMIGILAEPEVSVRRLAAEDAWIVAATDGVWDGLEPELVARIAGTASTAKDAAERILAAAIENTTDNVSIVAVRRA